MLCPSSPQKKWSSPLEIRVLPVRENQTLSVFRGEKRPLERIISSNTFARNVGLLVAYLSRAGRP